MTKSKVVKENIRLHKKEAEEYEENNPEIFNDREKNRIKSVLDDLIERVETESSERKALDVGCGTGNMLKKLAPKFDKVIGIDLSGEMLSRAFSTIVDEDNSRLIRASASNLPFPDEYFDMVSAYSMFHHLPSFSDPISEISRVLKKGGILYIDHEPINREEMPVKMYLKFCDILNGEMRKGFPPYEETGDIEREHCDYHLHHGEDGGLPISQIKNICNEKGLEVLDSRKYLSYGSKKLNPLYPIFKPFFSDEWLLKARKRF